MGQKGATLSANRLLHQFEKTGARGEHCRPFRDMSKLARDTIAKLASLAANEDPVIACFFNESHWTLLSTNRLIWTSGLVKNAVNLTEINTVTVPSGHLLEALDKKAMKRLSVGTADGNVFQIHLEPGRPFFGFWNVLKLVAR